MSQLSASIFYRYNILGAIYTKSLKEDISVLEVELYKGGIFDLKLKLIGAANLISESLISGQKLKKGRVHY